MPGSWEWLVIDGVKMRVKISPLAVVSWSDNMGWVGRLPQ